MKNKIIAEKKREIVLGQHYEDYDKLITEDTDCYYIDENGEEKILFKFRKNVIPKKLSKLAIDIFKNHAKKINYQRSIASGGKRRTSKTGFTSSSESCRSQIAGFFDKPPTRLKKYFSTSNICRKTSFTKNNKEDWEKSLPFFEKISYLYKKLSPKEWKLQTEECSKIPKQCRISDTPFTTVTVNYNWRTATHKDSGDYPNGLGNLTITGTNFGGCYVMFPEYKIAIRAKPNDFILMNVHQPHCNTPIKCDDDNFRLSFVCYMRSGMVGHNKKVIIQNEEYFV